MVSRFSFGARRLYNENGCRNLAVGPIPARCRQVVGPGRIAGPGRTGSRMSLLLHTTRTCDVTPVHILKAGARGSGWERLRGTPHDGTTSPALTATALRLAVAVSPFAVSVHRCIEQDVIAALFERYDRATTTTEQRPLPRDAPWRRDRRHPQHPDQHDLPAPRDRPASLPHAVAGHPARHASPPTRPVEGRPNHPVRAVAGFIAPVRGRPSGTWFIQRTPKTQR